MHARTHAYMHACCVTQHMHMIPQRPSAVNRAPTLQVFGSGSTAPQFAEAVVPLKAFLADHRDAAAPPPPPTAAPRTAKTPTAAPSTAVGDGRSQAPGAAPPPSGPS